MTLLLTRRIIWHKPLCCKNVLRMLTETCVEPDLEEKPSHIPVMVNEVVDHLNLKEGNVLIDMTFGAGGHSKALLQRIPGLRVFALDRDPTCKTYAQKLEREYPGQVVHLEGKFSDLPELLAGTDQEQNSIDGILFDLGCSSMQFDIPDRGFSATKDGPLDMRMDGDRIPGQLTAADVIANASEDDLFKIFKVYGEEKRAKKIARMVIETRQNFSPIRSTKNLVDLIETVCTKDVRVDKIKRMANSATKVFQALRIFINNEINELNYGLILAHKYLKPGGRAVAISFHSLEDRVVKRHFSNQLDNCLTPLPLIYVNVSKNYTAGEMEAFDNKLWNRINKKVILPSKEEVSSNPRSRSAKLRAAVKLPSQ